MKKIILFSLILLITNFAFAEGDTVTTVIYNVCHWLSGPPGVGMGILGTIYSGYEFMHGEIQFGKLLKRSIGMGLIIGGAYIGQSILMQGM